MTDLDRDLEDCLMLAIGLIIGFLAGIYFQINYLVL